MLNYFRKVITVNKLFLFNKKFIIYKFNNILICFLFLNQNLIIIILIKKYIINIIVYSMMRINIYI